MLLNENRKWLAILLATIFLALQILPGRASEPAINLVEINDPIEMEAFFDGVMAAQLNGQKVAGAVVAVVKDGEMFFTKGYGYSDLETRAPVSPEETLFRPGSVSKLFVWTAVMQLVEQGRLDLHADVNDYLDFPIPDTYPEPITMAHLLTHTPGFEEISLGIFARSAEDLKPLDRYLQEDMPRRIRPPGNVAAYSNYGTTLAGYIVGRISGMPYEQYIEEHIFRPLNMDRSTFRQPLPYDLETYMSAGYVHEQGRFREVGFEYVIPSPAGSLSSPAIDMANFMISHLQLGRFGEQQILGEDTTRLMHSQQFSHDPQVMGMTYGWMELEASGRRAIWHGGDTMLFHTALILLPEEDIGLYVSYNSLGGAEARSYLMNAFFEHYLPSSEPAQPTQTTDLQRLQLYAGFYRMTRSNVSTPEKLLNMFQPVSITALPEGELRITGLGPQPTYWTETEADIFLNTETYERLVFGRDESGLAVLAYMSNMPILALERLPWHSNPSLHFLLLGLPLFLGFVTLLALPIGFLATWRFRRLAPPDPIPARLANLAAWLFSLLTLAFAIGLLLVFSDMELVYGLPGWASVLFALPWINLLLSVGLVFFAVLAWLRRYWTLGGRIFYSLLALSAVGFVVWTFYWNILP